MPGGETAAKWAKIDIVNLLDYYINSKSYHMGGPTMEKRDLEMVQKYVSTDPELKRYMEEHEGFERKLAEFNRQVYLTADEEIERKKIQKLKLAGRDRIEAILAKYRSREVGGKG
jgi:uncharacterized protein YdcH (DUF465 family)